MEISRLNGGFLSKWPLPTNRPSLCRYGWWLHRVEANFSRGTANQKHNPDLSSGTSSVWNFCCLCSDVARDPFNQNSDRSDREKWSTLKGGPVFSKLSGWTERVHWVWDRNLRKFWLNGSRPLFPGETSDGVAKCRLLSQACCNPNEERFLEEHQTCIYSHMSS